MDSAMAMTIVNVLNRSLSLALPLNTCHIYIDLDSLTRMVLETLSINPNFSTSDSSSVPVSIAPSSYVSSCSLPTNEPIAIVGQALRLPGDIDSPASLWEALTAKRKDIMINTPEDRWDHASFNSGPGQITFEKSGFIDIASFDATFFGISPTEAIFIAPTGRLALESAFEALENANIPISKVKGTNMAVFVAAGLDTAYNELLFLDKGYEGMLGSRRYKPPFSLSRSIRSIPRYWNCPQHCLWTSELVSESLSTVAISNKCFSLLDIHGPSMTIETACSGGLVALDQGSVLPSISCFFFC
jgi:acyl transferase domain-containing protein